MTIRFDGRVAIVTGEGGGFGRGSVAVVGSGRKQRIV